MAHPTPEMQRLYFRGESWVGAHLRRVLSTPAFAEESLGAIRDTIFGLIDTFKAQRDAHLRKHWSFYHGNSQIYATPYEGETTEEFARRLLGFYEANRVGPIVDKHAGYLYGRADEIVRRCEDEEAQKFMLRVWDYNDIRDGDFMMDTATMTLVSGFSVVMPKWVDERSDEPFVAGTSLENHRKYGVVKYVLLDSTHAMLLPHVRDARRLGAIILIYYDDDYTGVSTLDRFEVGAENYQRNLVVEYIDDTHWIKWTNGGKSRVMVNEGSPALENKNFYADVRIPFVVFKEGGDPMLLEGSPLPEGIEGLNLRLNERLTDDGLAISHHAMPILKVLGAALPDGFRRTHSTILELQGEPGQERPDAEYLTWEADLGASDQHEDKLMKLIDDEADMSAVDWGDTKALGQVRSADGIRAATRASQEGTNRRKRRFAPSEKWLIRSSLRMREIHTQERFESHRSTIIFPDFITPTDLAQAQTQQIELVSGQESLEDYVRENYPDLATDAEIKAKVDELRKTIEYLKGQQPGLKKNPRSSEERQTEQTGGNREQ